MNEHKFIVEEMRFHFNRQDTLVFVGWFYDGNTFNHTLSVQLDGQELSVEKLINKGAWVCQKYIHSVNEISEEIIGVVKLPKDWQGKHRLAIRSTYDGKPHKDAVYSVRKLMCLENQILYSIDNVRRLEKEFVVNGWCMGNGEVNVSFYDSQKKMLMARIDSFYKKDLDQVGLDDEKRNKLFFAAYVEYKKENGLYIRISNTKSSELVRLDRWNNTSRVAGLLRKLKKAVFFYRRNGVKATLARISDRLGKNRNIIYEHWLQKYGITEQQLEEQRAIQAKFQMRPKFSIAVPLFRTEEFFLRELIASLQNQTYDNWELCFADGSEDGGEGLSPFVSEYQKKDGRIRYQVLKKNYGISQNMNEAMDMAKGDFVVLLDHDDTLTPDALFEFAKAINEAPSTDVIYSDEDKTDLTGKVFSEPHFKSDFNLDLLLTNNYICHLFAVKRVLLKCVGGFRTEYDGSQDYDFILRCCESAKRIYHVPKVLYHWRCHFDSTAANPQSKLYAFEAGRRAVEAHYRRLNIPADVEHAEFNGLYRTHYKWTQKPLVSVVISNTDHVENLSKCIRSVLCSNYDNYEIVIIENGSKQEETFAYYEKLKTEQAKIRVIAYQDKYHLPKSNNLGETAAMGDYLLLLNHSMRLLDSNCIEEMLGHCMREDVGIVGAKILYEDETIQHAGIVLGTDGAVNFVFRGKSRYAVGYESRIICPQDYSAVSAACMMVKRDAYIKAGGMEEGFSDLYSNIDFCLKIRKLGLLIVYNPYAEVVYHEEKAKSADIEDNEKYFDQDSGNLCNKWGLVIGAGDPYYNPNLTLDKLDFSLRI